VRLVRRPDGLAEKETAMQQDMIHGLHVMTNDKKNGGVSKAALAGKIRRRLGPDMQQKK